MSSDPSTGRSGTARMTHDRSGGGDNGCLASNNLGRASRLTSGLFGVRATSKTLEIAATGTPRPLRFVQRGNDIMPRRSPRAIIVCAIGLSVSSAGNRDGGSDLRAQRGGRRRGRTSVQIKSIHKAKFNPNHVVRTHC